jgi:hypothetical protein
VSKTGPFAPFIYIKTNILPGQARDEHSENSKKERTDRFSSGMDSNSQFRTFHTTCMHTYAKTVVF